MSGLWQQFAALGSTILLLAALSRLGFVKALWHRNVTDPFAAWVAAQLDPLHQRVQSAEKRLCELAEALDYQFKNNGGHSLRDRIDLAVEQTAP